MYSIFYHLIDSIFKSNHILTLIILLYIYIIYFLSFIIIIFIHLYII